LNYLDRITITTMRGSLRETMSITDGQFGLLTAVFLWVYGVLSPLGGFLADRFSRSRVIVVSLLVWSLVTWLTAHATTFNQLLTTRALMGVSEACYLPAALALIADYHKADTRSLATGIHMTGLMVGSGFGGLGGWIADRYDWPLVFTLFGVVGIAYAGFLGLVLKDAPSNKEERCARTGVVPVGFGAALASLFSQRAFSLALGFWSMLGVVGWLILGWAPAYFTDNFHLRQGEAGLSATGYLQIASLIGVVLGGFWADRWSRRSSYGRIYVPLIGIASAAPAVWLLGTTDALSVAVFCLMFYGFARSFADANMMPILCLIVDPRSRATGYGVLNCSACVVGGVMVYVGGALRDAGVSWAVIFQTAAFCAVLCAVFLGLVRQQAPQNNDQRASL
jgi:MFS family permease